GVPAVVAGAVLHEMDEAEGFAEQVEHGVGDIDIRLPVAAADVVCLAGRPVVSAPIYALAVVDYVRSRARSTPAPLLGGAVAPGRTCGWRPGARTHRTRPSG